MNSVAYDTLLLLQRAEFQPILLGMKSSQAQIGHFHVIEVSKLGYDFSVTHLYRGQVLFTATYEKEMDALRIAAMMGTSEEGQGNEVLMNILYNRNPGAYAR